MKGIVVPRSSWEVTQRSWYRRDRPGPQIADAAVRRIPTPDAAILIIAAPDRAARV